MFKTKTPLALPGTCMLCPGSVREEFLDTEQQIEWYGAVLFCNLCVTEMGRLFGMATPEEVQLLKQKIEDQREAIFDLEKKLAGMEAIRDGMALAGFVVPHDPGDVAVPSSPDEGDAAGVPAGTSDVGGEGGASPEPVHDEGLAELRSNERSDAGTILGI